ncbi:MAG: SPASM domain-containing protein [Candidatus Methanomethylicaceae archaeon]
MENKWARISENCFLYYAGNKTYLIQTLPFKILRLANTTVAADEVVSFVQHLCNEQISKSELIPPRSYYLPLVIVTNACNLACNYCYAWEGSYGMTPHFASKEIIDRTLELTKQYLLRLEGKEQIDFGLILFGGEPTLSLPILEYSVVKALEVADWLSSNSATRYRPVVTVNTNALSFSDSFTKLVRDYGKWMELIVSYDGLWHDENRIDRRGIGSSKRVEENIQYLLDLGVELDITMVVPPAKMNLFRENIEYVTKKCGRGININPSFVRGAIPSVERKATYPGRLEQSYTPEIVSEWGEITSSLILDGYNIYWKRFRRRVFEGGYLYRCPAMLYEFCVTPLGDVYPCHNLTEEKFKLGNILDSEFRIEERQDVLSLFLERRLDNLYPCRDCLFQTICLSSFDCPAHSLHDLGDFFRIDERFCPAAQKIMDGLLQRFIQELESEPDCP